MAGQLAEYVEATATGSATSITSSGGQVIGGSANSGSLTVSVGDMLVALLTYDAGDTTVALGTTFGTFTEDTGLQKVSQSPRTRVLTCVATSGGTGTITNTLGAARTNRGILVCRLTGISSYITQASTPGSLFPAYFNPGNGADLVTPGNFNVATPPNYFLSFGWDQSGGGTAPPAGTTSGGTSRATAWNFADATANLRVSDKRATGTGNTTCTYNSGFGGHSYAAVLLGFVESAVAASRNGLLLRGVS